MPQYTYQAVDSKNKRVKGTVTARTMEEAEDLVRQMGLYPIAVYGKTQRKSLSLSRKIGKRDVLSFTIQLHLMFTAGLPLLKALETIGAQEKNPKFQEVIQEISKKVESTGSFSEAIAAHPKVFPPFYIGAIRAGESGGNLADVLEELTHSLEKQEEMESQLKQALMYPILIMTVMSGVTGFYAFYLLPKMMGLVTELGAPIPLITRMLMFGTGMVRRLWIPLIGLFIVAFIAFLFYRKTESGAYVISYVKLKFPLFGPVIQKSVLCTFVHYLSLLLRSGFGLLPSLDLVKGTIGNRSIVRSIEIIQERIKRGESFASAMTGLPFPSFLVSMIALGEETGKVEQQLTKVNEYFEKDITRTTKRVLTILEPLILVGFGGIAAVILLSTFFPLYNAMSQLR